MTIPYSDYNSDIDIITQVGMIEPVVKSASLIPGVFSEKIEIVGSYPRKNYFETNKPCIDLLIPVESKETAKKVIQHFQDIPGPSKSKEHMVEIGIGWGWIGVIPAICTNIKNYFYFVDYKRDYYFLTNPIIHINFIINCGRKEIIKGLKKDLASEEIEINSFILELMVIDALINFNEDSEIKCYKKVLEYMVQKFPHVDLLDPSNKDNIISKTIRNDLRERIRLFGIKMLKNL